MFRIWIILFFFRFILLMEYLFHLNFIHKISYMTQKPQRFKFCFLLKEKKTQKTTKNNTMNTYALTINSFEFFISIHFIRLRTKF